MEAHMHSILVTLRRLARDKYGATAIEYGLLTALIAVMILAGVGAMGNAVNTVLYEPIGEGLRVAAGP
jgi:pilus assembly protein Flp/PilA